ncbi:DNA-directed RNA polymerase III subunit RPC2 [Nosema bombycis CQ1]|uniref:DNA-directed RNA polymerase subunit beta n=1 Tax=Nosema bombycis (strain CQ1 / CVCC 102059) TaxID=578461 RepID=R0KQ37_NOSB1|nr:DNA-directed RNA polymerase III subunit RPC2 [Nosema bombycis CQ1]|eukprot:EOB12317.1 DNA-directed RNA polymerase III subunit RPC2 [Nosema bombycis CQ1]
MFFSIFNISKIFLLKIHFYPIMMKSSNVNLINLFFKDKGLARQHIESFNYFIEHDIENIIKANDIVDSDIDHLFYLKYTGVRVGMPSIEENMVKHSIYPIECRQRDLTYASNIYVDIEYVRNRQIVRKKDVFLGKIPIMLKSCRCYLGQHEDNDKISDAVKDSLLFKTQECPYDIGGYFVVRGIERVILIQEQLLRNRMIIESNAKGYYCSVTSDTHEQKSKTSVTTKNDCFYVKNSMFSDEVPVITVIKACGMVCDRDIMKCIGKEFSDVLSLSFEESKKSSVHTQEQALRYLSSYIKCKPDDNKIDEVRNILVEKLLPNIEYHGTNLIKKATIICFMIRRLVLTKNDIIKEEDKDFMGNKRFELAGQLISILFEDTFKKFNWELKRSIDKILSKRSRTQEFDALTFFNLQTNIVTSSLSRAISTGNWYLKRFRMERGGVTQVLTRHSYISAVGMMSKICSHFEKTRKVSGPRALHTSSWGMLCPADTPEGESCGLVKNLALLAEITTDSSLDPIKKILIQLGVIEANLVFGSEIHNEDQHTVFVNGDFFGITKSGIHLVKRFREFRRKGDIDKYVSIYIDDDLRSINISADNGRICRPLLIIGDDLRNRGQNLNYSDIISDLELNYKTFDDLISDGKIEYVDANEENDILVVLHPKDITPDTTHMEIAEFAILGYVAGLIPFPNHNQSPRNTYQCAMGKQAIGYIALNSNKRYDGVILQLCTPQRPLTTSHILNITDYNKIPAGQNAMVAVMSYSGYDIEDALVINKNSLDRGFARTEVYKTFCSTIKRYSDNRSDVLMADENNAILDQDGIGKPGELLVDGSVFINKMSPCDGGFKFSGEKHKGNPSYIDRVLITKSEDHTLVKATLRQTRVPEIGDKFSSRHGQKGVVGLIVPQTDMPFSDQGIVPDIIMNPHGFPSRMTVGKIIELLTGKAGLFEGKISDSTVFKKNEVDLACDILVENGFNYGGKDFFYSGTSGEPLQAFIFYGPVFYQRLKHMVADKIHMRARGPRAILTRQPTEGRSRDGGLRLGEMERDCLIGYGASSLITERLMESSDAFDTFVCKNCGVLVFKAGCNICNNTSPTPIRLPYACKLLFQELMSMNILPKIHIK